MNLERYEKLKLIELCEIGIRSYENMAYEAKSEGFKLEMMHEVEICELLKEKIEGDLQ